MTFFAFAHPRLAGAGIALLATALGAVVGAVVVGGVIRAAAGNDERAAQFLSMESVS